MFRSGAESEPGAKASYCHRMILRIMLIGLGAVLVAACGDPADPAVDGVSQDTVSKDSAALDGVAGGQDWSPAMELAELESMLDESMSMTTDDPEMEEPMAAMVADSERVWGQMDGRQVQWLAGRRIGGAQMDALGSMDAAWEAASELLVVHSGMFAMSPDAMADMQGAMPIVAMQASSAAGLVVQQHHRGLPVHDATVGVSFDGEGMIDGVVGAPIDVSGLPDGIVPMVSAEDALTAAAKVLAEGFRNFKRMGCSSPHAYLQDSDGRVGVM